MAISPENPAPPGGKPIVIPLLKACLVASLVFTLAWIRSPFVASAQRAIGIFIVFGILITIYSMIIGSLVGSLLTQFKVRRWWVYLLAAAASGALSGAVFSSHPPFPTHGSGEVEIANPRFITFSPWTRDSPLDGRSPLTYSDYFGTIAFGALVGSSFGISFWYFYSRRTRN